ncbi:MAG: hypothetical protein ACRCZ0_10945 [Cetobacterium sp.]
MKKLLLCCIVALSTVSFAWEIGGHSGVRILTQRSETRGGDVSVVRYGETLRLMIVNRGVSLFAKTEASLVGISVDGGHRHIMVGMAIEGSNIVSVDLDKREANAILPLMKKGNMAIVAVSSDSGASAGRYCLNGFTRAFKHLEK